MLFGLLAGCQSVGVERCGLEPGTPATNVTACNCQLMSSSGAGVIVSPEYGRQPPGGGVALQQYLCPQGKGEMIRVTVVNGVIERIYR